MQLEKEEIDNLERIYRLNLINSITGIKPANLIATKSKEDQENIAIFSSVVHLGSNPALIGFVMRPQSDNLSDTYKNITETGYYSINHVSKDFVKKAHYTSAKMSSSISEFDRMKIQKEYVANFHAPFVKDSPVKLGMKFKEGIPLPNGCIFIIGSIELLTVPDHAINDQGQLNLELYDCMGISGLNKYYSLKEEASYPYARKSEIPEF